MFKLMFTENGKTIIRNFVAFWFIDAAGRLRKLKFPDGMFILVTGNSDRRLDFVADKNRTKHGEPALSLFNLLMFAGGAISAVCWDSLF